MGIFNFRGDENDLKVSERCFKEFETFVEDGECLKGLYNGFNVDLRGFQDHLFFLCQLSSVKNKEIQVFVR